MIKNTLTYRNDDKDPMTDFTRYCIGVECQIAAVTTIPLDYIYDLPWYRVMVIYEYFTELIGPDERAKHPNYKNHAPDTRKYTAMTINYTVWTST